MRGDESQKRPLLTERSLLYEGGTQDYREKRLSLINPQISFTLGRLSALARDHARGKLRKRGTGERENDDPTEGRDYML